jgi:hypothetical protein
VPDVGTPFTPRFETNDTGDFLAGNTLETTSTVGDPGRTPQGVVNAQNGVECHFNGA